MTKQGVLILGKEGQLATALKQHDTIAGRQLLSIGRPMLDMARPKTIDKAIEDINPALVINATAYTAVDKAETETEAAFAINASGVGHLGHACAQRDIPVIHVSTDYVFAGTGTTPYQPDEDIDPQGAYGKSKAQGETELRNANEQHLIFRTAWLYSGHGNNFLKTMMRLGQSHDQIRVVDDQYGTPTYADDLATGLVEISTQVLTSPQNIAWGTYHLTNAGKTTWCGFAREIFNHCANQGLSTPEIIAITTKEYPTPAARPAYSVLDCGTTETNFGVKLPNWENATARCLKNIKGTS